MGNKLIEMGSPYVIDPHTNQISTTYPDTRSNARHYVMWSGGTDSTLLLYELLKAYGPHKVTAISYKYPWLASGKVKSEKDHRLAFAAKMNIQGLGGFQSTEVNITQETISGGFLASSAGAGLPQALAWLLSVPIYAEQDAYVYDGGIRNDDLTLRMEAYHSIIRGIAGVMQKGITFRTPYIYLTKAQILEKLIAYDLYDCTWYCEIPNEENTPCDHCVPCRTHIAALNELILYHPHDSIGMKAREYLTTIVTRMGNHPDYHSDSKPEAYVVADEKVNP